MGVLCRVPATSGIFPSPLIEWDIGGTSYVPMETDEQEMPEQGQEGFGLS